MEDPNKRDKRLQDLLLKKKKRKPASEAQNMIAEKKAKRDAIVKMRDQGMEDIVKSLSKKAVLAEKSGDMKEADRLSKKIEKLKNQAGDEKDKSSYSDGGTKGKTSDGATPYPQDLYSRVKSEAKKKFKGDYPSAYASSWIVREFKKRGGKYKK